MNLLELANIHPEINVTPDENNELFVLKYSTLAIDWSNPITILSRGLIVDKFGQIIAHPFDKFFNYKQLSGNESMSSLSEWRDEPFVAMDKLDGSMITVFLNPNDSKVHFSTSGMMGTPQAKAAEELANSTWSETDWKRIENLAREYTLVFEYVGLENMHVIPYDESSLTLIGARSKENDVLSMYSALLDLVQGTSIPVVNVLPLSTKEEVLEYINTTKGIEGIVVQFQETGHMLKFKTQEYMDNHYLLKVFNPELGLSERYITLVIESLVKGEEINIDDTVAFYRQFNNEKMNEAITKLEKIVSEIAYAIQSIDLVDVKINEWLPSLPKNMYQKDFNTHKTSTEMIELSGFTVPTWFAVSIARELEPFHRSQRRMLDITHAIQEVNNQDTNKAISSVREAFGEVGKYDDLISPKSYMFQQYKIEEHMKNAILNSI